MQMQPVQHVGNYDAYGYLRARNPWVVTSEKGVSQVTYQGMNFSSKSEGLG